MRKENQSFKEELEWQITSVMKRSNTSVFWQSLSCPAKKDMESMLDYVDKLNELDTDGVEPMSHVFPVNNVFREDIVTNGDDREEILANAPERKDGAFVVPKTVE